MSSEIAIDIEGLAKRFEIGGSDTPTRFAERLLARRSRRRGRETVWALREVDLKIPHGEVVGLIGRNGAGKSTLLKILTRVTAPTEGRVTLTGRVGSLLEVGTGFHPELSGRENVYMNGALLGMSRRQVGRALESIIEFAGVARFIDVPVKRYSSGMYMRLAFSVAAHLDTEILLVDEVLAVGDAEFQNRSLGRMQEAARSGRTVVFVSHNMTMVSQLCTRCIWLDSGRVRADGPTVGAIGAYLGAGIEDPSHADFEPDEGKAIQYLSVQVLREGQRSAVFQHSDAIDVEVSLRVRQPVPGSYLTMLLKTASYGVVFLTDSRDARPDLQLTPGRYRFALRIPGGVLGAGTYMITLGAASVYEGNVDHRDNACRFDVHDLEGARANRPGVLALRIPWIERDDDER